MTDHTPSVIDLSSPRRQPANSDNAASLPPGGAVITEGLAINPPWPAVVMPPQQDRLGGLASTMEINSQIVESLSPKDPQLMSHLLYMQGLSTSQDPELQEQYAALQKHYRMQADLLNQQFVEQRQVLEQEQRKMQDYLKVCRVRDQAMMIQKQHQEFVKQQQIDAQRRESEQREIQTLELIKHKNKDEQSAIASTEVKQKLRACLLKKTDNNFKPSPPDFRQWAHHGSLDQHSPPTSGLSPPLRGQVGRLQEDLAHPLRKTVSEPSLPNLKMRPNMRQKLITRNSPLLNRRDPLKKNRHPLAIDTPLSTSNPDSGPNSPPTGPPLNLTDSQQLQQQQQQQQKEDPAAPLNKLSNMVINQSLPNISLGQPRDKLSAKSDSKTLSMSASEAEMRVRAPYGLPLPTGYPYYPIPVLEGEMSPTMLDAQIKAFELARSTGNLPLNQAGLGASPTLINTMSLPESSHPRIAVSRPPLHRTNSAPLPLPGQMLWNQQQILLQKQQEQLLKETHKSMLVKHKLQSQLLQRSSSKSQMENVDESAENRLQGGSTSDQEVDVVVIDDRKDDITPATSSPRAPRAFLQKMRQRAICGGSPPITAGIPEKTETSANMELSEYSSTANNHITTDLTFTTGLAYDNIMLRHDCLCGDHTMHPENPDRLQSILSRLSGAGLLAKCEKIKSRKATPEELKTCHSEAYVHMYGSNPNKLDRRVLESFYPRFCKLPCGGFGVDSDTVWNDLYTPQAARMAAGCVIDLAFKVARGDLQNGFALVRPPGHHAEDTQAMGFCFFNSIAVATKLLLDRLQLQRILIVDWDVHHGNSTQQLFYTDPRVLYISLHRHDNGNFFPGTGAPEDCGIDKGVGFNVNIAFTGMLNPPMGDAEYLAAFRTLVMPIAREYQPELVLISAGFDAAQGHPAPLGGYMLSPQCFGYMTKQLMTLAEGKVALVLEGGYILPPMCDSVETCVKALLCQEIEPISEEELCRHPCKSAIDTMQTSIKIQAQYWTCVARQGALVGLSAMEAQRKEREDDTVTAFASLSVVPELNQALESSNPVPMATNAAASLETTAGPQNEQPMEES